MSGKLPGLHPAPDDLHRAVLQAFFWDFVDKGIRPESTPLFADGPTIAAIIVQQFGLTKEQAQAALEAARQEVEL